MCLTGEVSDGPPAYPSIYSSGAGDLTSGAPSYLGQFTPQGAAEVEGYISIWSTHKFNCETREVPALFNTELQDIVTQYLKGYSQGMLLRLIDLEGERLSDGRLTMVGSGSNAVFTAVCGSNDGDAWEWKGFHRWSDIKLLPNAWQKSRPLLV